MLWFSLALVVVGNVIYQLGQRAIPRDANPVVATLAAYVVAMVVTLGTIPFFARGVALGSAWQKLNGSTILVGVGAVVIELGFLLVYRAGWGISTAPLLANSIVALVLLGIGAVAFREPITMARAAGIVLCLAGLWLVARPAVSA
jgi:uncharacterized membrane protein